MEAHIMIAIIAMVLTLGIAQAQDGEVPTLSQMRQARKTELQDQLAELGAQETAFEAQCEAAKFSYRQVMGDSALTDATSREIAALRNEISSTSDIDGNEEYVTKLRARLVELQGTATLTTGGRLAESRAQMEAAEEAGQDLLAVRAQIEAIKAEIERIRIAEGGRHIPLPRSASLDRSVAALHMGHDRSLLPVEFKYCYPGESEIVITNFGQDD